VGEGHENIAVPPERYTETDYSRLDGALQELDIEQREVLVMSRYQGLKYEEIAVILGLSVNAVKVRVHRSILALRKVYFKNNQ
jgi:RNA polymerase sigma-70 factor (ECF subfamily)